jgi:Cdc6-like AAA superfamily ATPase
MDVRTYALTTGYLTPKARDEGDAFVGPRRKWADEFIAHLRRIISSGRVPKAVIYGPLGVGKTHFLSYISSGLAELAKVVYVETPPLHRRSRFTDLHNVIMRKIGRDYSMGLLSKAVLEADKGSIELHSVLGVDPDIATIIRNGLTSDKSVLWRYLSGEKLTSGEVRQLDAVSAQLREDDAAMILNMIARLVRRTEKKQFLLFIDEFENTSSLMGDSQVAFREALRGLMDESNDTGVVISNTAREMDDMPLPLTDESVQRRIGFPNYRLFPEYTPEDLLALLREIITFRRDDKAEVTKMVKKAQSTTKESVSEENFPFTQQALEMAVNTVFELRQLGRTDSARPKEALDILDSALSLASEGGALLVETQHLEMAKSKYPLTPKE